MNQEKNLNSLIEFLESQAAIKLNLVAGSLINRKVEPPGSDIPYQIFFEEIHEGKTPLLFILRSKEMNYLRNLPESIDKLYRANPAGIVLSFFTGAKFRDIYRSLIKKSKSTGVPLFTSRTDENKLFVRLTVFSLEFFSPSVRIHANLLDVYGIGVLIKGESGIGKSECSLELLKKGHRLVADDIVEIRRRIDGSLIGTSPYPFRHHLEIRGIGIINVHTVFGVGSVRDRKRVDLVAELVSEEEYQESLNNLEPAIYSEKEYILETPLPLVKIPTKPGRSVSSLIEIAALKLKASQLGFSAAKELDRLLIRKLEIQRNK